MCLGQDLGSSLGNIVLILLADGMADILWYIQRVCFEALLAMIVDTFLFDQVL